MTANPLNYTPASLHIMEFDREHEAEGRGIVLRRYADGAVVDEYIQFPDGAVRSTNPLGRMEPPPRDYRARCARILAYYEELVRRQEQRFNETKAAATRRINQGLQDGTEAHQLKKVQAAVLEARGVLKAKREELERAKPPALVEADRWRAQQAAEEQEHRARVAAAVDAIRI